MEKSNTINPLLNSMGENVMGFLNEIQEQYPNAISLASGRPDESFFDLENFQYYFNIYVETVSKEEGKSRAEIIDRLGQYNSARGIVNELTAKFLEKEEGIKVNAADILMTVGSQEGMAISLLTLCDREKDVILVEDPTYIGITHLSLIAGYQIEPVAVKEGGIFLKALEEKITHHKNHGKKVKMVYVIPDFQNPTGNSMSLENRQHLLELAEQYDFFIVEDNAYGEFVYQGTKDLSLKAMDLNKRVIYLRSFSKTLYPTLRLGAMVADQTIQVNGISVAISDLMAKTKGYLTVNTSSINQAIFGGMLIKNNFSFRDINTEKIAAMKQKRDALLAALNKFLNKSDAPWAKYINWNIPKGGFFLTVSLPFSVDKKDVVFCAENHNVLFTPMSFFYFKEGGDKQIRLAFSNISIPEIEVAIKNLSIYFKNRINNNPIISHEK